MPVSPSDEPTQEEGLSRDGETAEGQEGIEMKEVGSDEEDEALEAAMTHAHEIGVHQGVTRAMVIRAYPK